MKQIDVTILGQGYRLACADDGEGALHAAVQRVDREMSAIQDSGKVKSREKIAVLAALNLAVQRVEAPAPAVAQDPALDARLDALVQRIDRVLGEDGRLI